MKYFVRLTLFEKEIEGELKIFLKRTLSPTERVELPEGAKFLFSVTGHEEDFQMSWDSCNEQAIKKLEEMGKPIPLLLLHDHSKNNNLPPPQSA